MTVNFAEDGKQIVYTASIYISVATVAVLLRFFAKQKTKSRYGLDDLWMLLALMVYVTYSAVVISSKSALVFFDLH